MDDSDLTPLEKLTKARIQLQISHPFWAYLSLGLRLVETPEDKMRIPSAGVDCKGNMFYCKSFIEQLSVEETKTVLAHEVSHVAYCHLFRAGARNKEIWNVAADYVVNNILKANNFKMLDGTLHNDKYVDWAAEQVYDDLMKNIKVINVPAPFDMHIYGEGSESKGGKGKQLLPGQGTMKMSPSDMKRLEREWKRKLTEAYEHSRRAGTMPAGVDRLVDKLLQSKISWRTLLNKYLMSCIPYDWSYRKPSKISRVLKTVYLPSMVKENIDIIIGVDTSCSISDKELALFKGDMLDISNSFNQVTMHIISCDAEVHDDFTLRNGTKGRFEKMQLKGGGGTDLRKIFDRIEQKGLDTTQNVLILFTDGYTPFPEQRPRVNTIFVSTDSPKTTYPDWGYFIKVDTE